MFYGILDPETGALAYASAGHNPGLLHRHSTGAIERLPRMGPPLALAQFARSSASYRGATTHLEPGDVLLQTTDGVHEAFGSDGDSQFGFERIETILKDNASSGVGVVLERVQRALDSWRHGDAISDDETLLAVARAETGVQAQQMTSLARRASAAGRSPELDVDEIMRRAQETNAPLRLPTNLETHPAIRQWLQGPAVLPRMDLRSLDRVTLLLYELVANVAEHGHDLAPDEHVELWWLPDPEEPSESDTSRKISRDPGNGRFVMVDHGKPFQPPPWTPRDYTQPEVRRSARGHGLDIIQRMADLRVYPSTSHGNVTTVRIKGHAWTHAQRGVQS
jgi:anti-sigma regulatory factor (Ser/Thr protein kinase)